MSSTVALIRALLSGTKIRASVNKDIPRVEAGAFAINGYSAGELVNLPVPLVEALARKGYVSLTQQDIVTMEELGRILWSESKDNDLITLDKLFYVKARLSLIMNGDHAKEYSSMLRELVLMRLRKILIMLSMSPSGLPQNVLEKLTIEEEVLVKELAKLIEPWVNAVTSSG